MTKLQNTIFSHIQGMHVTKLVGIMFVLIFFMDLLAAIGYTGVFSGFIFTALIIGIIGILLIISRQPQNRYVLCISSNNANKLQSIWFNCVFVLDLSDMRSLF